MTKRYYRYDPDTGKKEWSEEVDFVSTDDVGTAAQRDVGTDSGNVMPVGAFGIGSKDLHTNGNWPLSDLESSSTTKVPTGFYLISNIQESPGNGFILHINRSSNDITQQFWSHYTDSIAVRRWRSNGGWTDWLRLIHTGNILKTTGNDDNFPMSQKAVTDELDTKADKSEMFSGSYDDLTNKPSIPSASDVAKGVTAYSWGDHASEGYAVSSDVQNALNTKNTQGTGSSQTRTNSQNDSRFIQGGSVVQGTGSSTTDVMSQKAVTDELNNKADKSELFSGDFEDLTNAPIPSVSWNNETKVITYDDGKGNLTTIDLIEFTTDNFITSATYDKNTTTLILQDTENNEITVDLKELSKSATQQTATITFQGSGAADDELKANVRISTDTGNILEQKYDGLYVADPNLTAPGFDNAVPTYETLDDMEADTPTESPVYARVMNDANPALNGYYIWDGSTWSKTTLQPVTQESIGEFGVLATFVTDFNTISTSGIYRAPDGGVPAEGSPIDAARILLEHIEGFQGRARQIAYRATSSPASGVQMWTRARNNNGEWDDWVEIITRVLLDKVLGAYAPQAEFTTDFNTISTSGVYRAPDGGRSAEGDPTGAARTLLEHIEGFQGRARQVAYRAISGKVGRQMWTRARDSKGEWSEWVEVVTGGATALCDTGRGSFYSDSEVIKRSLSEAESWSKSTSSYFENSQQLNGLFQNLANEFPDYVSSEKLGEDDFGNDIWEFRFTPPRFRWIAPATPSENAHPKIVVVAGTHGSESMAMLSNFLFFNELTRSWQEDEVFSQLRWGCEFVVIPCLNPWGLNNGKVRRNGNNVDLNRNMPWGWEESEAEDKGPSPLSEPESVIAHNLPVRHPTAKTFIDFHAHENDFITWIGTRSEDGFAIQKHALRIHQAWLYRNILPERTENTSLVTSAGTVMSGIATNWTYTHGKKGFLLETHVSWSGLNLRNRRRIAVDSLARLIYENWKVESETTGWVTGPPLPPSST